jgi:hypothetical protein
MKEKKVKGELPAVPAKLISSSSLDPISASLLITR